MYPVSLQPPGPGRYYLTGGDAMGGAKLARGDSFEATKQIDQMRRSAKTGSGRYILQGQVRVAQKVFHQLQPCALDFPFHASSHLMRKPLLEG